MPNEVTPGLESTAQFPRVEYKNVDTIALATLHQILDGTDYEEADSALMAGEVGESPESGPWVFKLPDTLTKALAGLDPDSATKAASEWVVTEEWSMSGASKADVPEFTKMLLDIGRLAKRAITEQKALFLWWSL